MKQEGQPSADVPPSSGDPPRASAVSPDHVVAAAADAQKTAKPQPTAPATEPLPGAPSPAASVAAPERVDWTAILEERALVPDSEPASPIAEAVVVPGEHGRRRGLLYLIVALTALFSLVASAAVVVALLRDDKAAPAAAEREREDEVAVRPPPQEPPPAPAAGGAAADPVDQGAATPASGGDDPKAGDEADSNDKGDERASQGGSDEGDKGRKPDRAAKADDERASEGKGREGKDGKGKDGKGKDGKGKDGEGKDSEGKDSEGKDGKGKDGEGKDGGDDGAAAPAVAAGDRPDKPSVKDLASAMKPLEPKVHACAKENGVTGTAAIKLEVGADGKVAWAAVREGGPAFQGCVNKVVRAIKLPASENGGTLIHSVSLPDP